MQIRQRVVGYSFLSFVVALVLLAGCRTRFADQPKHLAGSRRVGCKNPVFAKKPAVSYDFNSAKCLDKFQVVNGEWLVKDGKLWAVSGKQNRSILLTKSIKPPFLIELEVTNYANPDGSIGDITILLNSENSPSFFSKGYALTTGSYFNSCTTFYRLGKAIAKTEYSPLRSGQTYKVKIEMVNEHIRYWLDNKIILEAWDAKPLKMNPALWIGIRTWNTKMAIDSFSICLQQ